MTEIIPNLWQGGLPKNNDPHFTAVVELVRDGSKVLHVPFYLHLPIEDGPFPGHDWLENATALLKILVKNHKVYVHCREGISRSAMLVAAYLMREEGMGLDQSLNFIATKNPKIDPNPRFMFGLKSWQR